MPPIKITLKSILAHDSCEPGLERLLKAKPNLREDEEFDLLDLLETNGLDDVLWALECLPEHGNLWRKYAVWCARQVQHLMTDERSLKALDVAWAFSEGKASKAELDAAQNAAWDAAIAAARAAWDASKADWAAAQTAQAASFTCYACPVQAAACAANHAACAAYCAAANQAAQKQKLKEILEAGEWVY